MPIKNVKVVVAVDQPIITIINTAIGLATTHRILIVSPTIQSTITTSVIATIGVTILTPRIEDIKEGTITVTIGMVIKGQTDLEIKYTVAMQDAPLAILL